MSKYGRNDTDRNVHTSNVCRFAGNILFTQNGRKSGEEPSPPPPPANTCGKWLIQRISINLLHQVHANISILFTHQRALGNLSMCEKYVYTCDTLHSPNYPNANSNSDHHHDQCSGMINSTVKQLFPPLPGFEPALRARSRNRNQIALLVIRIQGAVDTCKREKINWARERSNEKGC